MKIRRRILIEKEETQYFVLRNGDIISGASSKEKKLKPTQNEKGYDRVRFRHNDKKYTKRVHRRVAEYFVPNPNKLSEVNHKDGNKQNNCADNLEWCTRQQNMQHAAEQGLSAKGVRAARSAKVGKYLNGMLIKTYDLIKDAEKDGHTSQGVSGSARLGIRHHGFHWKYL